MLSSVIKDSRDTARVYQANRVGMIFSFLFFFLHKTRDYRLSLIQTREPLIRVWRMFQFLLPFINHGRTLWFLTLSLLSTLTERKLEG